MDRETKVAERRGMARLDLGKHVIVRTPEFGARRVGASWICPLPNSWLTICQFNVKRVIKT